METCAQAKEAGKSEKDRLKVSRKCYIVDRRRGGLGAVAGTEAAGKGEEARLTVCLSRRTPTLPHQPPFC